jgi:hypothetical protein
MWGVLLAKAKNDRRLHALDWLVYSVVIGISQWLYFNRQLVYLPSPERFFRCPGIGPRESACINYQYLY